jgi:hypothetical protein
VYGSSHERESTATPLCLSKKCHGGRLHAVRREVRLYKCVEPGLCDSSGPDRVDGQDDSEMILVKCQIYDPSGDWSALLRNHIIVATGILFFGDQKHANCATVRRKRKLAPKEKCYRNRHAAFLCTNFIRESLYRLGDNCLQPILIPSATVRSQHGEKLYVQALRGRLGSCGSTSLRAAVVNSIHGRRAVEVA